MIFYLIRIIIILIAFVSFNIMIMIRNKKRFGKCLIKFKNYKTLRKRKILPYILYGISILLIFDLLFYPFEGYFIRFNSLEDSIFYSIYDCKSSKFQITEDDDTIFFVQIKNTDYSYHSVAKPDGEYYMCDFNTDNSSNIKMRYLDEKTYTGIFRTDIIKNKTTNKRCYFVKFDGKQESDLNNYDFSEILDNGFKEIYKGNKTVIFYLISDKDLTDNFSFDL